MDYLYGPDKELQEFSVQQLLDCDTDNYGCTGGWMYQGFAYISKYGVLRKEDYRAFTPYMTQQHTCEVTPEKLEKGHMKDIGYVEHDRRTNSQLKEILQKNTVSMSMFTTGLMQIYKSGVLTEDFLRCSYTEHEVNHGLVIIGYGKVQHTDSVRGRCKEYWILRNSWGPDWGEHGFFRLCADGAGSDKMPFGTCLVNKYAVWPTMDKSDIDPS